MNDESEFIKKKNYLINQFNHLISFSAYLTPCLMIDWLKYNLFFF